MSHWIASNLLTHTDAVKARNELIEDPDLDLSDGDRLEVDCYTAKDQQLRYGVKVIYAEEASDV